MSTAAIDTARTSERLSVFLSEVITTEPVDNFFPRFPVLEALMKNSQVKNGGRQILANIDSGKNNTVKSFNDFDQFAATRQDTALTVVYPMKNIGGIAAISEEEVREVAGDKHATFDLVKHVRNNLMQSIMNELATQIFAATPGGDDFESLPNIIDSTGTTGNLSATTDPDWAATETASGSFASQGLTDMRTTYNTIVDNGGMPDTIATSRTVYEYYENEVDPDVRYSIPQAKGPEVGARGFKSLEFKGIPIIHDSKATSDALYMWDSEHLYLCLDKEWNFSMGPFRNDVISLTMASIGKVRGNLITVRRKSAGKLTGITA